MDQYISSFRTFGFGAAVKFFLNRYREDWRVLMSQFYTVINCSRRSHDFWRLHSQNVRASAIGFQPIGSVYRSIVRGNYKTVTGIGVWSAGCTFKVVFGK